MHVRSLIAVAAALVLPGSAGADPAKPPPVRQAAVQLASAEKIAPQVPVPAAESQPAKQPRAMRVTTCRCGDAQPQPEPQR